MISELLQFLITGLAVGAINGMVALGLVTIYNVTGVVNFAQGVFPMLGGLLMVTLVNAHVPIVPALLVCAIVLGIAGIGYGAVIILPFRRGSLGPFIAALGAAIATEGVALLLWGFDPLSYEPFTGSKAIDVMGALIYTQAIWILGFAAVLLAVTHWFFERTYLGKAVRACAMSRIGARAVGVDVRQMALLSFSVSAAACGVLGAVVTPLSPMAFTSDIGFSVNGFAAAVFGGLIRPLAAFCGALVLGVIGSFSQAYLGRGFDLAATLTVMLVVLVWHPDGVFDALFSRRAASR